MRYTKRFPTEKVLEHLEIYSVPILNDIEHRECFTLTSKEKKALKNHKNCDNAVYFLISLIYFKLKKALVSFRYHDVALERQHIMARYVSKFRAPRSLQKVTLQLHELKVLFYSYATISGFL